LFAFVLLVGAALSRPEFNDYTPIETRMCWGIAELDGCRFVTDCAGGELLQLGHGGRMTTAANGQPSAPRGLCAAGGLLALRNRILERMSYVRDSRWKPADVCLERGTGSCSEYTCIFAGAARGMGMPVRFVGGTSWQSDLACLSAAAGRSARARLSVETTGDVWWRRKDWTDGGSRQRPSGD